MSKATGIQMCVSRLMMPAVCVLLPWSLYAKRSAKHAEGHVSQNSLDMLKQPL